MAEKTLGSLRSSIESIASAYNVSAAKPTLDESVTTNLVGYFNDMKSAMKNITGNYSQVVSYKRKIEEAYVVAAVYQLYGTLFKEKLEAFRQITALANVIKDSSSDFNYYIGLIEKALGIYYSDVSDDQKASAKKKIIDCLSRIKTIIKDLMGSLSFVPSDATVDTGTVNDDGTSPLKSASSKSFIVPADQTQYSLFETTMNIPGYVAEKSTVYVKIKASDNVEGKTKDDGVSAYVTEPLSGMLNQKFSLSSYTFLLFWTKPCYESEYTVDNDGSDANEKGSTVAKSSVLRLGGFFSQTNVFSDGALLKYKYDASQASWKTGTLSSIGTFIDGGMSLSCGFSGSKSRIAYSDAYRMSDSVTATFKGTVNGSEYVASGTLDYDKSLSEETMKESVYSGSITLKSDDQSVSRPVLIKIAKGNSGYSVSLMLDKSSSVNSSSAISDNPLDVSNLVPALLSRTYEGVAMSDAIPSDDGKGKAVQALESVSSLTTDDMGAFSSRYAKLKDLIDSLKSALDSIVNSSLYEMAAVGNTATSAMAIIQSNDANYDSSGYASDVETSYSTLAGGISSYSSVSESTSDAIYGGTAYTKLNGYFSDFSSKMNSLIDDLIEGDEILSGLGNRLLLVADAKETDADFGSSLLLFSNIITGISSTVEAYASSGTEFQKIQINPYSDWVKYYEANVTATGKRSVMEYLYLLSVVNRHDREHSDASESTSDAWLSALNRAVTEAAMGSAFRIDDPFKITDEAKTIKTNKTAISVKTGFEYSSDPNSFYIHPMVTKRYGKLSEFDNVDLTELFSVGSGTSEFESFFETWKQIVYAALIDTYPVQDEIPTMMSMFSGRKLNIRELCLAYVIGLTVEELRSDSGTEFLVSRKAASMIGTLKESLATIKEYADVYKTYLGASADMATVLLKEGSVSRSLIENGIPED